MLDKVRWGAVEITLALTMDPLLEQFEQAVGDQFAEWLSQSTGYACPFIRRAGEAPDLVYSYRGRELLVEVTGAYYDGAHAAFLWKQARGATDAPTRWFGTEPDKSLANAVLARVQQKSLKRYGSNVVLLIDIPPGGTRLSELLKLLEGKALPDTPFAGIYVLGTFPKENELGGVYLVHALKELADEG